MTKHDPSSGSVEPETTPAVEGSLDTTWREIQRYKADGDVSALNSLFGRYYDRVLSIVRIRMGPKLRSRADAQDIAQEAFIAALRRIGSFEQREHGALICWLSTIVEYQINDRRKYIEAEKRDPSLEQALPESTSSWVDGMFRDPGLSVGSRAARKEMESLLESCIEEIQEKNQDYGEVLVLRLIAGMSPALTAQQLGKTTGATAMLFGRAKTALIECFLRKGGSVSQL